MYTVGSFYRRNLGLCTNWTRCTCNGTSSLVLYLGLGFYWASCTVPYRTLGSDSASCTVPVPPIFFSRGEQRAINLFYGWCTVYTEASYNSFYNLLYGRCTDRFYRSNRPIHMFYRSNCSIHMFYRSN